MRELNLGNNNFKQLKDNMIVSMQALRVYIYCFFNENKGPKIYYMAVYFVGIDPSQQ